MCGIAGYSGPTPINLDKFRLLMWAAEDRGTDSTGVYGNQLFRLDERAIKLLNHQAFKQAVSGCKTVIGHTRWATVGAHSIENAHPYVREQNGNTIIGTHNGTVFEEVRKQTAELFELDVPEVDSMLIYDILAKSNGDFKLLQEIEGTMALSFIFNDKLHLYRRSSKPLFFAAVEKGMYYSSLADPLFAIGAEKVFDLETDKMFILKEGKLVEEIDIPPPIVHNLSLDCSTMQWKSQLTDEEEKRFLEKYKLYSTGSFYNKSFIPLSEKPGTDAEEYDITGNFNFIPPGSLLPEHNSRHSTEEETSIIRSIKDTRILLAKKVLKLSKKGSIKIKLRNVQDWGTATGTEGNKTRVIVNLVNEHSKGKITNWPVFFSTDPECVSYTSVNGFTILHTKIKKKTDSYILVVDPMDRQTVYSAPIRLKPKGFVEVTLNIPVNNKQSEQEDVNDIPFSPDKEITDSNIQENPYRFDYIGGVDNVILHYEEKYGKIDHISEKRRKDHLVLTVNDLTLMVSANVLLACRLEVYKKNKGKEVAEIKGSYKTLDGKLSRAIEKLEKETGNSQVLLTPMIKEQLLLDYYGCFFPEMLEKDDIWKNEGYATEEEWWDSLLNSCEDDIKEKNKYALTCTYRKKEQLGVSLLKNTYGYLVNKETKITKNMIEIPVENLKNRTKLLSEYSDSFMEMREAVLEIVEKTKSKSIKLNCNKLLSDISTIETDFDLERFEYIQKLKEHDINPPF